ncbi:UPF0149 family protein [Pleionea litopenaei]|uniref:UPF0149 family protein n=1 Tax=Pleionea litopenaei TaxID=3070815 RepID=A0AA51RRJ4_9GAMM|nr:UPF0149 family protein [Pleionea sp. HL-JVS1]WMS86218.1 UPF0149 family protein [Pleionea sp. HL-JVS1]
MTTANVLNFDDLEDILAEQECETQASELQGMICGLFAGGMANNGKSWKVPVMQHLNEGKLFPQEAMTALDHYVQHLGEQLEASIFELNMLLPPESASIEERLHNTSEWAQGFLLGYGMQVGEQKLASDDLNEAIEDLMEIAKVDLEVEENEQMEQALYTVIEHVKVTAQVVYLETRSMVNDAVEQMQQTKPSIH